MHEIGYVTTGTKEEAVEIGKDLVEKNLVACVNFLGEINSIYWWKNKIHEDEEYSFIFKTKKKNEEKIIQRIKELHSYDNPSIVFTEIRSGSEEYLKWIDRYTK